MKNMMLAFLVLVLSPALAFAGGSKGTSQVTVTNNSTSDAVIILDAPAGFDPKQNTVAQFTDAGGKKLNAGESITLNVKSGHHQFGAAFVTAGKIGKNFTEGFDVPNNKKIKVTLTGTAPNAPTVTITNN